MVGNKVDLEQDRAVSREEGKAIATEFGAAFLEVSVSILTQDCHDISEWMMYHSGEKQF